MMDLLQFHPVSKAEIVFKKTYGRKSVIPYTTPMSEDIMQNRIRQQALTRSNDRHVNENMQPNLDKKKYAISHGWHMID